MQKKTENLLYSGGGLVAAFVILVLLNLVLGAARGRIDLTQGKLFTLSEGTRAVLSKLESPVKIRLYFTQGDAGAPLPIKAYGRRVEDLLAEFRQAGRGKVLVEKLDPQPDSDAEDSATLEGIEAQVTPTGEKFYLGAAASTLDQNLALPALTPDREPLLEYDLTRAIARATATSKPVVGVMSALPVFGMPPSQFTGGQPLEPQVFVGELRRDYTVKRVSLGAARSPRSTGRSRPGDWASTRARWCSTCATSPERERALCRRCSRSTTTPSIPTTSRPRGSGRC